VLLLLLSTTGCIPSLLFAAAGREPIAPASSHQGLQLRQVILLQQQQQQQQWWWGQAQQGRDRWRPAGAAPDKVRLLLGSNSHYMGPNPGQQ
jgi:hypothetical protein